MGLFGKNNNDNNGYLTTTDYSIFKFLPYNRPINENNLLRIIDSMKRKYLFTVITVTENYEVIDGQHRLKAAMALGLPVNYKVEPGYDIDDIHAYNTSQKNWNKLQYLDSYCKKGLKAYMEVSDFMKTFPDFGIQASLKILLSSNIWGRTQMINGKKIYAKDFENGKLKIGNTSQAYINARKIVDFKDYYSGYNRTGFVGAVLPLFSIKIYDHKRMMQKLKVSSIKLDDCSNVDQYRLLLQKIYNWKSSPNDRADFINV